MYTLRCVWSHSVGHIYVYIYRKISPLTSPGWLTPARQITSALANRRPQTDRMQRWTTQWPNWIAIVSTSLTILHVISMWADVSPGRLMWLSWESHMTCDALDSNNKQESRLEGSNSMFWEQPKEDAKTISQCANVEQASHTYKTQKKWNTPSLVMWLSHESYDSHMTVTWADLPLLSLWSTLSAPVEDCPAFQRRRSWFLSTRPCTWEVSSAHELHMWVRPWIQVINSS